VKLHCLITGSLAIAITLSGCATQPIPTSQASFVPDLRILDKSIVTPKDGAGQVIVKRDGGIGGSACNTRVFANGRLSAELAPSEKVILYLPEGAHIISAWPNNPCGGGMVEAEARVSVTRPITFRIGYGSNGDFGLYPTAF